MVLEGMTGSRIANLEKNCNRNPVAYMHYLDQEEDQYDTPGNLMESPCENSTPSIPRTDTWSASTSYSPMHTSQQPNSLEQSDLYTSIKRANLFARNACSNSFSDDEDGTLSGADIPRSHNQQRRSSAKRAAAAQLTATAQRRSHNQQRRSGAKRAAAAQPGN